MFNSEKPTQPCSIKAGSGNPGDSGKAFRPDSGTQMLPIFKGEPEGAACCGPPAGPPSGPFERPGYRLCHFVTGFLQTPAGAVPVVETALNARDRRGTLMARLGAGRNDYKVTPGLYAVGKPDAQAPVLVSANYKLSFDHLRSRLGGFNAWLLVLDTRGINVWCAAGKGTFSTAELVERVRLTRLAEVVQHRRLILPQLAATGVAGYRVRKACGFEVVWGPVRASDLRAFFEAGQQADDNMRQVTFNLAERAVLVPVELYLLRKYLLLTLSIIMVLSGLGRGAFFSLTAVWGRGLPAAAACLGGVAAGCVLTPLLLPWIPGRAFALKGLVVGLAAAFINLALWPPEPVGALAVLALILLSAAVSSNLAMNFTGSTPFTSASGVEAEMKHYIPLQIGALAVAAMLWTASAYIK